MAKRILGVIGRNGSGKDTVIGYLAERCGIATLSAGDVVRRIAGNRGLEPTRDNLHAVSLDCMREQGRDYFATRLIQRIEDEDRPAVGITGLRTPDDVQVFRSRFGADFRLAHVRVGDADVRFRRLRDRGEARDPDSRERFGEQEREEENLFDLGAAIEQADFTIENDGSLDRLHRNIENSPAWGWLCTAGRSPG
jgi:dephospho-CoA kinase